MGHLGYLLMLGVACLLGLGVASAAWRNRPAAGARPLIGTALAAVVWAGCTAGLVLADAPATKLRWLQGAYLGMVATPITFLLVALEYTGRPAYVTRPLLGGLVGSAALVLGLVWTNPWHHLYWRDIAYGVDVPAGLATTPAAGFWGFVAYTYLLLGIGSVLLIRYALTAPHLYRSQSAALLFAVAAPWATNVPHALQWMAADYTPVALAVTVGALWIAMHHYRLTDLSPIALRTVFESISAGVFVLDRHGRVVEANAAARDMLGLSDEAIGASFDDFVTNEELLGRLCEATPAQPLLVPGTDLVAPPDAPSTDARYLEARVTALRPSGGRPEGRLVVLTEITERERQQRRLERKNQQLERFASVVSHDLRNPLNVAVGNLSIAEDALARRAQGNDEATGQAPTAAQSDDAALAPADKAPVQTHLERTHRALGRMATLIDDLLTLAAGGTDLTDPEPTSLPAVAADAWDTVDTKDATLTLQTDATIKADRSRLHQLLENLFHNAVVHGGPTVAVTVGDRPGGFSVSDDGPGFPDAPTDTLLDTGYTTREDGTGFGLGIVREIAEAHGWSLQLGTSPSGGAHIDVTGATPLGPATAAASERAAGA
jgi:signal transduction histidine kinase